MADLVVGLGEMQVSGDPDARLITYALGSCLGLALYDPVARVGGLLHTMLPQSSIDPERARSTPPLFVDIGVPALFRACYAAGAVKERILVAVAGGSAVMEDGERDRFQIGKHNMLMLRRLLWKNDVLLRAHDVGGVRTTRTMRLDVATGVVTVRVNGRESRL
jgi:chemotaxis protein CheD